MYILGCGGNDLEHMDRVNDRRGARIGMTNPAV